MASTPAGLKPGFTSRRRMKLRAKSPAPASSMKESAISETMSETPHAVATPALGARAPALLQRLVQVDARSL